MIILNHIRPHFALSLDIIPHGWELCEVLSKDQSFPFHC